MIFVDSGYLVALAQRRDSLHQRALVWAQRVKEPLLTTEYVFWEMFNALSAPVDRPKGGALFRDFESHPANELIPASRELFHAGLAMHFARRDKAWSLTDCISFALMSERGISRALAYEEHFEQAGFEAMLRRDPPLCQPHRGPSDL
jgi:uncharacterized protein